MQVSRRSFIKGALSTTGVTAFNLTSPIASAFQLTQCDSNLPYKALVGINLGGGNDGFNCFAPLESQQYQDYKALRGKLAWDEHELADLNLNDGGLQLALSPELEDLKWLFDEGKALPVLNLGPLLKERNNGVDVDELKPIHLFSHNHQSTITQSKTDNYISKNGWGSLSSSVLEDAFSLEELTPLFETGSHTVWTNSIAKSANRIGTSLPNDMTLKQWGDELYDAFRESSHTQGSLFREYYAEMCYEAQDKYAEFETIFDDEHDYGFDLESSIGKQLRVVFLLLQAREHFKHSTQFFSVTLGGFDTHNNQEKDQGALLRSLSSQLSVFYQRLEEYGLSDAVTTFTMSEFGRTLEPNGSGTDHGWGNCQMVIGGDVLGGRTLGNWPDLAEGSNDLMTRGRVIPTLSVDLFHASLLNWLGVREDILTSEIYPRLEDFNQSLLPIFRSCDTDESQKLNIVGASASAENPNGIDKTEHGIDNNMATKWSASGDHITYTVELDQLSTVTSVRFAQTKGHQRSYIMDLQVSHNGAQFDHVISIITDGMSENLVEYPVGTTDAKFVRFVCRGNTDDNPSLSLWNNFRHIEVWGK
ncbi:DUF1501 domain-containing protein [Vibrio crassostreae]|uniref:DUF1501 domain-containing protein n=1 Tax=Vibrio crassostreae TaxID=246167 RepID=UPI002FE051CA